LQGALITNTGNNDGPGATYWQKTVIWSAEDGNLYTHVGASLEYDLGVPYSLVIPNDITIRLMNGDTGEEVTSMPANPLASPTFNPAWQGGTSGQSTVSSSPAPVIPSTPASSSTTAGTVTPFDDFNYVNTFAEPQDCYLFFGNNGSWGINDNANYVVTGLSGGKLTLKEVGTDLPDDAMEFKVSLTTPTVLTSSPATFIIQNASTGEYLGGNASQGFGWYTEQGTQTVFSTSNAYSGNGFAMNIGYNSSDLTCEWFAPNGNIPSGYVNQWTFWAKGTQTNSNSNAIKLKGNDDTKESKNEA
jgi:hypothetical protein